MAFQGYSVAFAALKRNVKYVAEKNDRLRKSIDRYLRCLRHTSLRRGFSIWLRRMQIASYEIENENKIVLRKIVLRSTN